MIILWAPIVIIALFLLSLYFLFKKKRLYAFIAFIICVFLNITTESIPFRFKGNSQDFDFRVLCFNIDSRGEYFASNGNCPIKLLNYIDEVDPDILVLEELYALEFPEFTDSLCSRYSYHQDIDSLKVNQTAVVFTNHKIEGIHRIWDELPIDSIVYLKNNPAIQDTLKLRSATYSMTVKLFGNKINLICGHLYTNHFSMVCDSASISPTIYDRIKNVYDYLDFGFYMRDLMTADMRRLIDKTDLPMLVCGDMNDLSGSRALRKIQGNTLEDAWWKGGFGYGATCTSHHTYFRLDHVLYSKKDFELVNVEVPHVKFSDHYPIITDFKFIK